MRKHLKGFFYCLNFIKSPQNQVIATILNTDDLTADTEIDFEANTITPDTEINLPSITAYKNEDLQAVSDYDKLVTIFSGEDLYVAFLTDSL